MQFSLPGLPKAQEHSSLKSGGFLKINYALMEVVNNEKFINDPENLTSELLEGLALSNPDIVSLEDGNLVS